MFQNYFKTAWRNLVKNKFYSVINIAGMTAGLSVGILILLWVQDELSFNKFHKQTKNIYRLQNLVGTGSSQQIWTFTVAPIGSMAKQEVPAIKDAVRLAYNGTYTLLTYGDKTFNEENTGFADPSLFSVFDFPLVKGNPANPFPDAHSIVLTETTAKRYFGEEDAIGKTILSNDKTPFTVSGVIKDFPKNSDLRFDMVFPMPLLNKLRTDENPNGDIEHDFHQFNFQTYFLVQPGTAMDQLAVTLRNIHLRNKPDDTDLTYLLQPLSEMHLYNADGTENGMETVRMFSIVALLILAIACINYVNLSTARSMLRAKEVSMRKIVGAARWQLFLQFVIETALLFLFAAVLATGLIHILMPLYNQLSGKQLELNLSDYRFWLVILVTISGTLIASSIYPALLLSSFEPLKALKGKIATRINDAVFRKALVVVQFGFSVVLIIGTLVIGNQLDFIRSKKLGYDKEHVVALNMRDMQQHYEAVRTELLKQPGVAGVARSSSNIVDIGEQTGSNEWEGKAPNSTFMLNNAAIDQDFIPFFKIEMAAGKNFTGAVADSTHFILNEAAVREGGFKNPIGMRFRMWETWGTVIGVVKDFHFASMKSRIEPMAFFYKPRQAFRLYIKTTGKDASQAIAAAKTVWVKYNAAWPFSYTFLDDNFSRLYEAEQHTATLFRVFAAIAILISCLGLLGLATYTAQVRTREIGIRKVLGASVGGIVQLLAKDFIKLVLIAIVIAAPVAWYAMNNWLKDFVYKVNIGWMVFVVAGLLAIVIAVFTISFQAVKAALTNPVKNLRTE